MPLTSEWLSWAGTGSEPPAAWASGWLHLHLPVDDWRELRLELDEKPLPLLQTPDGHLLAQWPALEPGFCRLALKRRGQILGTKRLFVGARQLNQQQWLALLADLRYRLPARLLLRRSAANVPVEPGPVAHDLVEEMALLKELLAGPEGLFAALDWLRQRAHRAPAIAGSWQPLHRARRPEARQLRSPLAAHTPVWDRRSEPSLDLPENRFVAGVVEVCRLHLGEMAAYARASGDFAALDTLADWARELQALWRSHPLAGLLARPEPPANLHHLRLPAYAACFRLWRAQRQGWLPSGQGTALLAYGDLALLYQHFCALHLTDALLGWAQKHRWRARITSMNLARGRMLLHLAKGADRIELLPEASYSAQGGLISLSQPQRPDLSLRMILDGRLRLLLFETKYRAEAGLPLKADLDKLHAYRDAIRLPSGQSVVERAVLLYPGQARAYGGALEAWQMLPGQPAPALDERLAALLAG